MSVLFQEVKEPDSVTVVNNKFAISNYFSESPPMLSSTENYLHNLNGEEHMDLMHTGSSRNMSPSSKMMVALAWVMETDRRYFKLYPEVIMIDIIENTNNEKRPMLLVVAKDADGETFVVMRVYLPQQRRWIFKWIFDFCFRRLLGTFNCANVQLICSRA